VGRRSDRQQRLAPIEAWFSQQGWTPMAFQRQSWNAYLDGDSGLIQVPTGSGKTYAAVMEIGRAHV
jgi:ATP-dependent Lhr-like helicase